MKGEPPGTRKRSFTVSLSSLGVLGSEWCVVLFEFFLLFFVLVWNILSFAFSPVLRQLSRDQLTDHATSYRHSLQKNQARK